MRVYGNDEGWESDPDLFAQVVVTPSQWLGQAGEHLYTAQLLLPHVEQRHALIRQLMGTRQKTTLPPSVAEIYLMHCAFSLENAFKCVIAAGSADQIKEAIGKKAKLPNMLLGHDLVNLAARARFRVGIDDEHTLAFLSRFGTWAGRYPLSVQNVDYSPTQKLSDGKHYFVSGYSHDQIPDFLALTGNVYTWAKEKTTSPSG